MVDARPLPRLDRPVTAPAPRGRRRARTAIAATTKVECDMSGGEGTPAGAHAAHGQVVYLQLPAAEVTASAAFYEAVFGWSVDPERGRFEAPGIIGEWTTDRSSARDAGPVPWILADQLWPLLNRIDSHGGRVAGRPVLDGGERYLVECDDPAGNRIGAAVPVRRLTQTQTLVAVRDVEASSRWY